jgi:GTPase
VTKRSRKVVTVLDLCGHLKFLKTTIFGMVAMAPDYSLLVVGANAGLPKNTREHFGIALYLKVPQIIVVTKTDLAPPDIYKDTREKIKRLVSCQNV